MWCRCPGILLTLEQDFRDDEGAGDDLWCIDAVDNLLLAPVAMSSVVI